MTPLFSAICKNSPATVAHLLSAGFSASQEENGQSPLHQAILQRLLFQARIETGTLTALAPRPLFLTFEQREDGGIQLKPTFYLEKVDLRTERDKSELIAHILLAYGAKLEDVRPDDRAMFQELTIQPPHMQFWNDAAFTARLVHTAMYTALKCGNPPPDLSSLFNKNTSNRTHLKQTGNALMKVRRTVGQMLFAPTTPVAIFLAKNLPAEKQAYWQPSFIYWAKHHN